MKNDKSLGQHWLKDGTILSEIASYADLTPRDTVLEIGPGLGTLTSELLRHAGKVVTVEFDNNLAAKLPGQFPGKNLEVISGDILQFDLSKMPIGYKVVANVPYYITSKIIQKLLTSENKPQIIVLLVQKEVAKRLAASPGDLSLLAISAQVFARVELGSVVSAEFFTPPPKVDSQVVIFRTRPIPLVTAAEQNDFFHLVRAGFSSKRKKLRSSLAGGLDISKTEATLLLQSANISPDDRAEQLSIDDWKKLLEVTKKRTA